MQDIKNAISDQEKAIAAKGRMQQLLAVTSSAHSRLRTMEVFVNAALFVADGASVVEMPIDSVNIMKETLSELGIELSTLRDYYAKQIESVNSLTNLTQAQGTAEEVLTALKEVPTARVRKLDVQPAPTTAQAPVQTAIVVEETTTTRRVLRRPPPPVIQEVEKPQPPVQQEAPLSPHVVFDSENLSPLCQELEKYNREEPSLFSSFEHIADDIGLMQIEEWVYLKEGFYYDPKNHDVCNAIIRINDFIINWYVSNNAIRIFHMELNRCSQNPEGFRHSWPSSKQITNSYLQSILKQLNQRIADMG